MIVENIMWTSLMALGLDRVAMGYQVVDRLPFLHGRDEPVDGYENSEPCGHSFVSSLIHESLRAHRLKR